VASADSGLKLPILPSCPISLAKRQGWVWFPAKLRRNSRFDHQRTISG